MIARAMLGLYVCLLMLGTHWPRLEAQIGDLPRSDLYLHVGAFGVFTVLMLLARWFGETLAARNIFWTGVVSVGFAMLNEATQGLPIVARQASLDDAAANILGVALPLGGATLLRAFSEGSGSGE